MLMTPVQNGSKRVARPKTVQKRTVRKGKRRIHYGRLAVIVLVPVLLICLCVLGVQKFIDHRIQSERMAVIEEKEKKVQDVQNAVAAASAPANLTPSSFAAFQDLAKAQLGSFDSQIKERIHTPLTQEDVDAVQAMSSPEDLYKNILDNIERYPQEYIDFLNKDPRRLNFVSAYVNQEPYIGGTDALTESLEEIPALVQYDLRWGYIPYAASNIGLSGSYPAAISAAASYLTKNPGLTPIAAAQALNDAGAVLDDGSAVTANLPAALPSLGIEASALPLDGQTLLELTEQRQVILGIAAPGTVSDEEQAFVISYSDQPDSLKVHFPAFPADDGDMSVDEVLTFTSEVWALSAGITDTPEENTEEAGI